MTENEHRFSEEEKKLILDTIGNFQAERKDCVGRCLSAKKAKGMPINKQAIAICMQECDKKRRSSKNVDIPVSKVERKVIPLNDQPK